MRFELEIDEAETLNDVVGSLLKVTTEVQDGASYGAIRNHNGDKVGHYELTEKGT